MGLKKLQDYALKSITGVSNVFLVTLTIIVTMEVIARKLFDHSFTFVSALTAFVFPWLVFLAIISVTKYNDHIGVQFFLEKFKDPYKKIALIFNRVIMLFFSLFMLMSSYELTEGVVDILVPILNISRAWLYGSMVVSFLGTSIVLIFQIISIIKNGYVIKSEYEGVDNNDLGHGA